MASGRKNYFRHSFDAHNDEKLQTAIGLIGFEAYYYYFSLLEMCGKKAWDSEETPEKYVFHLNTIRILWQKQTKSCKSIIEKLEESGLFSVTFSQQSYNKVTTKLQQSYNKVPTFNKSFVEFHIPNLPKYLGRYQVKNPPKGPKKRKEKKRKESNTKPAVFSDDISQVVGHLNQVTGKKYKASTKSTSEKIQARLNENNTVDDLKKVIDIKFHEWNGSDMAKYIRPETLFGNKFESYLNQDDSELVAQLEQKEARLKFENLQAQFEADEKAGKFD